MPTENGNPFKDIDTSQFDGLYDNPNRASACPDPEDCESLLDLLATQGEIDIDAYRDSLDGYLDRSDPYSVVGSLFGSNQVCDPATGDVTEEVVETEAYSCHSTFESTDHVDKCAVPLEVVVDVDHEYSCNSIDEEFCTGPRQNRGVILGEIYVSYGDFYVDDSRTHLIDREEEAFREYISVPGCYAVHGDFLEDTVIPVEYHCAVTTDLQSVQLPSGMVEISRTNCVTSEGGTSGSCEPFEANGECRPAGDEYCDGPTTPAVEALSCVPDGDGVRGLTCKRNLHHELEVKFEYECKYIYDESSGELRPDPKCADLLEDESCSRGDKECTQSADLQYEEITCKIGDELTYTGETCEVFRYGIGTEEFRYVSHRTWEPETRTHQQDDAAEFIAANSTCREGETKCVSEAPETFETAFCKEGYEDLDTSYECVRKRIITIDNDYVYGTRRSWSEEAGAHLAADNFKAGLERDCLRIGEVCETSTPPTYESHRCLKGYRLNDSEETCQLSREIVVDTDYGYQGKEIYNYNKKNYVKDAAFDTLSSDSTCRVIGRSCTKAAEYRLERTSYETGYYYYPEEKTITFPRLVDVDTDYIYEAYSNFIAGRGFVDTKELKALKATASCELTNEVCVETGPGVFSTHQCRIGYTQTFSKQSCDVPLKVETDSDYIYQASEHWNSFKFVPKGELTALRKSSVCKRTDRFCARKSPGVFEDYACNSGFQRSYVNNEYIRKAKVRIDTDYYYKRTRSWNGSIHAKASNYDAVLKDSSCKKTSTICSKKTPPPFAEYTCRQGYQDNTVAMSCQRKRIVTVDIDYSYTVNREWSTKTKKWTGTSDWNAVRSTAAKNASCELQSQSCNTQSPGVFSNHSCEIGYVINDTSVSCTRELQFTTETDYRYTGYKNWNGSRYVSDATLSNISNQRSTKSCVRDSSSNEQALSSAERTSRYECVSGSITYSTEKTCRVDLKVTVTPDPDYRYITTQSTPFSGTHKHIAHPSDCAVIRTLHHNIEGRYYNNPGQDVLVREVICQSEKPDGTNGLAWALQEEIPGHKEADSTTNTCQGLSGSYDQVCVQGRATRSINGYSVTRDCWAWERTYGSTLKKSVNACSPPSGFKYVSEATYTGSPALGETRALKKKRYEKVEGLSNSSNIKSAYECFSGYWLNKDGQKKSYSCSPPSGATQVSNVCAWNDESGTCRLYARSYTVPNPGPTSGYKRIKEVWTCDKAVTGSGVRTPEYLRTRKSWYWTDDQCPSKTSGFSEGCVLKSEGYTPEKKSKTVDGLTITRQFTWEKKYSCSQKEDRNTCSALLASRQQTDAKIQLANSDDTVSHSALYDENGVPILKPFEKTIFDKGFGVTTGREGNKGPPSELHRVAVGDYNLESETCVNYEDGVCTLFKRNYKREEVDGSGGCLVQEETYKCEEAISGAGTAKLSRHIASEKWEWPSADCQTKQAKHDSCVFVSHVADKSTGGKRTINGLVVSRSSWVLDRNMRCTTRVETNTCNPPSNASVESVKCIWSDAKGVCRLSDYVYHQPLADPSGGCTTYTDTFLCENNNHGSYSSTRKELGSITYPEPAQARADRLNSQCKRVVSKYTGGRTPRVIEGVSVTPAAGKQWEITQEYRCYEDEQINTCNVPDKSTLVSRACLSEIDGGECSLYRNNYSVELTDPSGGCHEWREEYLCQDQVKNAGTPIGVPTIEAGSSVNTAACKRWSTDKTCKKTAQKCVEGRETRRINGINITKACWAWEYEYECEKRVDINTCSPKETAVLEEETCAFTNRDGACTLHDRTYVNEEHDPSGGCNKYQSTYLCEDQVNGLSAVDTKKSVARERWDYTSYNAMKADFEKCYYIKGSQVLEPAETRVIDGLRLTRNWSRMLSYDCYNREQVPQTSVGDGTIVSQQCMQNYRGACVRWRITKDVRVTDVPGECDEYTTNYSCEDQIASLTPYDEFKSIESERYNQTACQKFVKNFETCRKTSESCADGPETRIIDGLEVTRSCWTVDRNLTCKTREKFDTCTIPQTAINAKALCVWKDHTDTCRLFEHTYDTKNPDPTGGCTTYLESYKCEDQRSGPELLEITKEVATDTWDSSDCEKEADGSYCTTSTSCTQGLETRIIDGLAVERACWEETRNNSCQKRVEYNECQDLVQYGPPQAKCLWKDDAGSCRLFENSFAVPVDDGSGGCHVWEDSAWCGTAIAELEAKEHVITLTGSGIDSDACKALQNNDDARLIETTCEDAAAGSRTPEIVRHREGGHALGIMPETVIGKQDHACWAWVRDYETESRNPVNSCIGQIKPSCQQTSTECLQTSRLDGSCALTEAYYQCGIPGSDYCEVEENTFSCVGPATASSAQLSNLNGNLSSYEPSAIKADVIRSYFDNTECSAKTDFGTCELVGHRCLDAGGSTARKVLYAQDEYYQQFVSYAPKQLESCWQQERIYDCGPPESVSYCGDDAAECAPNGSSCLYEDDEGGCLLNVNHYSCETGGAPSCAQTNQDFVCENPVEGETSTGTTEPEVESEYDMSACNQVENSATCSEPQTVCRSPETVRYYEPSPDGSPSQYTLTSSDSSVAITSDCFEYENTYECSEVGDAVNDCDVQDNCEHVGDVCLGEDASGTCVTTEHNYECKTVETVLVSEGEPGTCEPANDNDPAEAGRPSANANIGALSSLLSLAQADRETGGSDFEIFSGRAKSCKRDVLGLKNCCKDKGFLLSLGIGTCPSSAVELAVQKEENRCIHLGSYCSKKAFFGACLKKKQSYCCYEAEIGRIVAEAGAEQLGRDFGTAKNPECRGFTVEEFQSLNLENVDFSSLTSSIMDGLDGNDTSQFSDTLRSRIKDMTGGG